MKDNRNLVLFFAFDVSLKDWHDSGLMSREVRLYEELAKRGWRVTFVTYGGKEDMQFAGDLAPIEVIAQFGHGRPTNVLLRLALSPLVLWKARKALKQADIVKTNQIWGGWNAVFAKWLFGPALMARGGYEIYAFALKQGASLPRRMLTKMCAWLTYRAADDICLATEDDKHFAKKTFGLSPGKIEVRPNWVDIKVFAPKDVEQYQDRVLFVGRFNEQKNLPALVEAVAGTKLTLDLFGWGGGEAELLEVAEKKEAKVNFLGKIANEELPSVICHYPVFVLPSYYEGNPKVLIEAMACGRAVLGTRVPGIKNLIDHEVSGLLCGIDPGSIREGLLRLAGDEPLRQRLGQAARAQIMDGNSFESYIERELEAYERLAARPALQEKKHPRSI